MKDYKDIIIVGAGPAGIAAAIAASKSGKSVLLIEKSETIGGMTRWINVLKGSASSYLFDLISSIAIRAYTYLIIDEQKLLQLYNKLITNNRIELKTQANVFSVKVKDDKIKSIKVLTRDGLLKVKGKVFIDCTGDGALCRLATKQKSDAFTEMSKIIRLGGIDSDKEYYNPETLKIHTPLPIQIMSVELLPSQRLGVCSANVTCKIIDGANETSAELMFLSELEKLIDHLQETQKGFKNCYIQAIASQTRYNHSEVNSMYTLLYKDMLSGKIFSDWVVTHAFMPLNHKPKKEKSFFENRDLKKPLPQTMPYGVICARDINNLLLAGSSALPDAMSAPIAMATGQAAGTAAALATKKQGSVKDLKIKKLQSILLKSGVKIPRVLRVTEGISPIIDSIKHEDLQPIYEIPKDASQILKIKVLELNKDVIDDIIKEDNTDAT